MKLRFRAVISRVKFMSDSFTDIVASAFVKGEIHIFFVDLQSGVSERFLFQVHFKFIGFTQRKLLF